MTIGELQYGVAAAADPLTDERNGRSAAAIRKLGATDLGIRQEHLVRRDGTRRQSRIFRLDRPGPSMPA